MHPTGKTWGRQVKWPEKVIIYIKLPEYCAGVIKLMGKCKKRQSHEESVSREEPLVSLRTSAGHRTTPGPTVTVVAPNQIGSHLLCRLENTEREKINSQSQLDKMQGIKWSRFYLRTCQNNSFIDLLQRYFTKIRTRLRRRPLKSGSRRLESNEILKVCNGRRLAMNVYTSWTTDDNVLGWNGECDACR